MELKDYILQNKNLIYTYVLHEYIRDILSDNKIITNISIRQVGLTTCAIQCMKYFSEYHPGTKMLFISNYFITDEVKRNKINGVTTHKISSNSLPTCMYGKNYDYIFLDITQSTDISKIECLLSYCKYDERIKKIIISISNDFMDFSITQSTRAIHNFYKNISDKFNFFVETTLQNNKYFANMSLNAKIICDLSS